MRAIAIVVLILALCLVSSANGAINPVLNYQGSLRDSTGAIYPDGSYSFEFSIYSDSTGGLPLWSEGQILTLKSGLIHAYLGSINPFDPAMFNTPQLYLGIKLGLGPEFTPRHVIGSSVFSFISGNSLLLQGYNANHFADSIDVLFAVSKHNADSSAHHPLYVRADEIVSGTIAQERLPFMSVDSTNIADGSVTGADLKDSIIAGSKILNGAISGSHLAASSVSTSTVEDGSLTGQDLQDSTISGKQIAPGSIEAAHLAVTAFGGENIIDGSLSGVDFQDSTISGAKIAPGSIAAEHLSGVAISGSQITDGTITGADIMNTSIGFNDVGPGQLSGYHLQDGSVGGSKLTSGTITSTQVADETLTGSDIASSAIVDRHIAFNSINSSKISDEPGLAETSGGVLSSVSTTVTTWMSLTVNAPGPGFILVLMHGIAGLGGNEAAQIAISTSPSGFVNYGEAKISSPAGTTGGNLTISITDVIPVLIATPVTVYGNVRASNLSAGPVDFSQGKMQAIYIRTGY